MYCIIYIYSSYEKNVPTIYASQLWARVSPRSGSYSPLPPFLEMVIAEPFLTIADFLVLFSFTDKVSGN